MRGLFVGGVLLDDLCNMFIPLRVKKQKLIVHTGKGPLHMYVSAFPIQLIRAVQSLTVN